MTLNPKNIDLTWFLAIFGCKRVNCDEMDGDRLRLPANGNCYRLSRVSWAFSQISCFIYRAHVECAHMSIPALAESSTSRVNICTKEETWRFDKWQRHYAINPAHLAAVKEVSSKLCAASASSELPARIPETRQRRRSVRPTVIKARQFRSVWSINNFLTNIEANDVSRADDFIRLYYSWCVW